MTGCDLFLQNQSNQTVTPNSVVAVLIMFALCMCLGHSPLQQSKKNYKAKNQVKEGYLLRYKRNLLCNKWCEEWFVLYEDSTLAWFADKSLNRPRGRIRISEAPELLAVGEWTRQVPQRPPFPPICHIDQLLAIGSRIRQDIHWFLAPSSAEVNDWMTAISNTLPPPPHLPLRSKRLSLTAERDKNPFTDKEAIGANIGRNLKDKHVNHTAGLTTPKNVKKQNYGSDQTVLTGVAIDWGHGWGWCHTAWTAHTACVCDAAVNSLFYHGLEDCGTGDFDAIDCSAFGDFIF